VEKIVLDTNVFIHAMRDADFRTVLAAWQRRMAPHIHLHSVVVAELLVGAATQRTRELWRDRWVRPAERVGRIIVPEYGAWVRASRIVSRLVESGGLGAGAVKAGFLNDCLLAATAREVGHSIVTYNLKDFELIRSVERGISVLPGVP
jgi:predicted nucleic acid-binding protein